MEDSSLDELELFLKESVPRPPDKVANIEINPWVDDGEKVVLEPEGEVEKVEDVVSMDLEIDVRSS